MKIVLKCTQIHVCLLYCNMPKMKAKIGKVYFVIFNYLKQRGRRVCGAAGC